MTTYKTDDIIVTVDNRLQGWGVSVDVWDETENSWTLAYDSYMISESVYEAVTNALCSAGIVWEEAQEYALTWGIEYPEEDED